MDALTSSFRERFAAAGVLDASELSTSGLPGLQRPRPAQQQAAPRLQQAGEEPLTPPARRCGGLVPLAEQNRQDLQAAERVRQAAEANLRHLWQSWGPAKPAPEPAGVSLSARSRQPAEADLWLLREQRAALREELQDARKWELAASESHRSLLSKYEDERAACCRLQSEKAQLLEAELQQRQLAQSIAHEAQVARLEAKSEREQREQGLKLLRSELDAEMGQQSFQAEIQRGEDQRKVEELRKHTGEMQQRLQDLEEGFSGLRHERDHLKEEYRQLTEVNEMLYKAANDYKEACDEWEKEGKISGRANGRVNVMEGLRTSGGEG